MFLTYSVVFLFQSRFFYYLATKHNKLIEVEVEQDPQKVTLSTISTYGLSPCHIFLFDGYYNPRSIRRGRKQPFLIVFHSFGSDRITAVFHRTVNERKRWDTPFSGRLRQLLTVYDTTKNGRNTITTKWAIYTP
jgi:hypothetical protein